MIDSQVLKKKKKDKKYTKPIQFNEKKIRVNKYISARL